MTAQFTEQDLTRVLAAGPFHAALHAAVRARGVSLEGLQRRLRERGIPVSLSSLSYWQRGRSRPERAESLRALRALEEILDLPPDSLLTLLPPSGRTGGAPGGPLDVEEVCPAPAAGALLEQIGNPDDEGLAYLSLHDRFVVGRDRETLCLQARAVFQARRDGVDRHVTIFEPDGAGVPDLRATSRCRFGRIRSHAESGLIAAELLFARPLSRGETYLIEYEFAYSGGGPPAGRYGRGFRLPHRQYLLEVQFHPAAVPARSYRTWRPRASAPLRDIGELRLSSAHTVHFIDNDVRPGYLGLRWEWC